jgi:exodeoxyribonuclease-3
MGDLNTLSPQDEYDQNKLLLSLRHKNIKKFGIKQLQIKVIPRLLEAGFTDTLKHYSNKLEPTIPTSLNSDKDHVIPLRLDYIFVSKNLLPFLSHAEIIKREQTDQVSDHFPIFAELKL